MSQLRTETFPKGTLIFKEGSAPEVPCMYDVLTGRVGIYLNYGTPEQKQLTTIEIDSYFGEMSLLENAPRSATAVALTDCILHVITEKDLQQYLQERPNVVKQMLQQMTSRLRGLTDQYMDICHTIAEREAYGVEQPKDDDLNKKVDHYAQLWNAYLAETHESSLYAQQYGWDSTWNQLLR